jgi:hypothetical protein
MKLRSWLLVVGSLFIVANGSRALAGDTLPGWNVPNRCSNSPDRAPQSDPPLSGLVACQVSDDPDPTPGGSVTKDEEWPEVVWWSSTPTLDSASDDLSIIIVFTHLFVASPPHP